jgi:small subunit ribosomal protein S20
MADGPRGKKSKQTVDKPAHYATFLALFSHRCTLSNMPNTKSAARRIRSSARQHLHNQRIKSRLKSLERNLNTALQGGKKEEAAQALKQTFSALDKAAKTGVIHWATASRKKSRLSMRLAAQA